MLHIFDMVSIDKQSEFDDPHGLQKTRVFISSDDMRKISYLKTSAVYKSHRRSCAMYRLLRLDDKITSSGYVIILVSSYYLTQPARSKKFGD